MAGPLDSEKTNQCNSYISKTVSYIVILKLWKPVSQVVFLPIVCGRRELCANLFSVAIKLRPSCRRNKDAVALQATERHFKVGLRRLALHVGPQLGREPEGRLDGCHRRPGPYRIKDFHGLSLTASKLK